MILWHGSDRNFDQFDIREAGTGEATTLGWGITLTEDWYKAVEHLDRLRNSRLHNRHNYNPDLLMIYRIEIDPKRVIIINSDDPVKKYPLPARKSIAKLVDSLEPKIINSIIYRLLSNFKDHRKFILKSGQFDPLEIFININKYLNQEMLKLDYSISDVCSKLYNICDIEGLSSELNVQGINSIIKRLETFILNQAKVNLIRNHHYVIVRTEGIGMPQSINLTRHGIVAGTAISNKENIRQILMKEFGGNLVPPS